MSKKSTTAKVSTASMKKDYIFDLDEPAEALSVSPDHSMVVVAGRQIMKVYEILDGSFSEKYNLRTRTMNLNYSASDVAWSPVQDNIIATTSTNGSVVIWNLEKSSNKIEKVFIRHSRAATKVCFHNSDPNIVISGSKDAKINLYDLRENEPIRSFSTSGGSDSVRDVQFGLHPDHQDMFVVADDSG
uniref:GATOR2 complex protein WDR24 n=1 Tax=Plectus sambesii TaxID=2011161 RepID=A0A914V3P2_9BILA